MFKKPISVDISEGLAMVEAAKKFNRVVQVGTQRKSNPHIIQAKQKIIDSGLLGKIGHVEMCCYYHMRAKGNPQPSEIPDFLNYNLWTGPAPLRQYDKLPHRSWWRAFMEYGNGITGDMCVHMYDTVRWLLGLDWPKKITSYGGIYVQKGHKANIQIPKRPFLITMSLIVYGTTEHGDFHPIQTIHGLFLSMEEWNTKGKCIKYEFIPHGNQKRHQSRCSLPKRRVS